MSAKGKNMYIPGKTLLRDEVLTQPIAWYRTMRTTHPVYYHPEDDLWEVFTYSEVQRVLTDYKTFSSEFIPANAMLRLSLVHLDPPGHRQLRNLVAHTFTQRSVARLAPRIATIVHELLGKVACKGGMDVVNDLAYPLPVRVIAEMLGVPPEDHARFKCWSDEVIEGAGDINAKPHLAMEQYFCEMLERRKREPCNDLISELLAARIGGEQLTKDQLLGFCMVLLVAGNVTTTHLISNAIICLDEHPEAMMQLRQKPALIPDAIEEIMRYRSSVRLMTRLAIRDTVLLGREIKAGQMVIPWIASANLDEQQFPHADVFDITRSPHNHLAFGYGIHFCLGAPLARLETRIALEAMLTHFPTMRRVRDIPLEPFPSLILNGVKRLQITFRS